MLVLPGEQMRLKFIRSFGVVFGIAAILLIAPTVCAASMGMPAAMQSSSPCQQGTPDSRYVTASSDMPSHCVLMKAMGEQVKPPNAALNANISLTRCLEYSPDTLPSQPQSTPYQQDILKIPLSTPTEHHCRNFLSSEEPPL